MQFVSDMFKQIHAYCFSLSESKMKRWFNYFNLFLFYFTADTCEYCDIRAGYQY